jgi:hypothetical protein
MHFQVMLIGCLSIDVNLDGVALVITRSNDRTLSLLDLKMKAYVETMVDHNNQIWYVAFFSPISGTGDLVCEWVEYLLIRTYFCIC